MGQHATCHFMSTTEAMVAQKSLWTRAYNEASEADWKKYSTKMHSGPYAYNELVLKSSPPAFGALFWAHSGPFRAATKQQVAVHTAQMASYYHRQWSMAQQLSSCVKNSR